MKVIELREHLQACDLNTEVFVQIDRTMYASPAWVGIMDTADLFAEEEEFRLIISPWEPEDDLRASVDEQG